jgi:arginyl-tRNA synthetase
VVHRRLVHWLRYRRAFATALAQALGQPIDVVEAQLKPANPRHGDFSFSTFSLGPAPTLAAELAAQLRVDGLELSAAGPYINARICPMPFTAEVLETIRQHGSTYGRGTSGVGRTVVIDSSSPNIAKPIAFHHIRSTAIGHALANLYRSQGWRVEGVNYLGDWGKQFGLVAVGFAEWGDSARANDVAHLVEVYVKANERAKADPAFDERARAFFHRMEQGDAEALTTWRTFREASLEDFKRVYARLGITFEHYEGESRYHGAMEPVIEEVRRTIGTRVSDGALVVDLPTEEGEPPVLLKKNDGATLYATRDLAAAIDRFERFHFDRALYVVAADQALHFRQVFAVLAAMGKPWAARCVHVAFGRVKGMSTRLGKVTLLYEVLDEAQARAAEAVNQNLAKGRLHSADPSGLAEQIGLGAVLFADLKNRRANDYEFDWDQALALEGHTSVYLQYAHARACKVLQEADEQAPFDAARLVLDEEQVVVRALAKFPLVTHEATEANEPSLVARALLELAAAFNAWYGLGNHQPRHRILVEGDRALEAARLALTTAVRDTLRHGLALLGITAPSQM